MKLDELEKLCAESSKTLGEAIQTENRGWSARSANFRFWHGARTALPLLIEVARKAKEYLVLQDEYGKTGKSPDGHYKAWVELSSKIAKLEAVDT